MTWKRLPPIKITPLQCESVLQCTRLTPSVERKLKAGDELIVFNKKELNYLLDELGHAATHVRSPHKQRLIAVQKKVDAILDELQLEEFGIKKPKRRPAKSSQMLMQLKVAILEIKPAVWRRIQIKDCSLAELHEHIQLAMGWENCHMHQFVIDGVRYSTTMADPYDDEIEDESSVMLSDILPKSGKRYRFQYVYDFGNDWRHEVLFEGFPAIEKGKKYPLCLEGERNCPPEDCGGPWGYPELLKALNDPGHEEHDDVMEWLGDFDAEAFSADKATKAMRLGLPNY